MSKYDYRCNFCNKIFEIEKSMNDATKEENCPDCSATMERYYGNTNFSTKYGTRGFYDTDNRGISGR